MEDPAIDEYAHMTRAVFGGNVRRRSFCAQNGVDPLPSEAGPRSPRRIFDIPASSTRSFQRHRSFRRDGRGAFNVDDDEQVFSSCNGLQRSKPDKPSQPDRDGPQSPRLASSNLPPSPSPSSKRNRRASTPGACTGSDLMPISPAGKSVVNADSITRTGSGSPYLSSPRKSFFNFDSLSQYISTGDGHDLSPTLSDTSEAGSSGLGTSDGDCPWVPGQTLKRRYQVQSCVGVGAFGKVFKCIDCDGSPVVLKVLRKTPKAKEDAQRESSIMSKISYAGGAKNHHIVKFDGTFKFRGHYCLLYEPLACSLQQYLAANQNLPLSLDLIRCFAHQLFRALDFLASPAVDIVHADLKPENIMFEAHGGLSPGPAVEQWWCRPFRCKLIDFGSALHGQTQADDSKGKDLQSRFYRAPEVILGYGVPTHAIDMWACGCILAELRLGRPLFASFDLAEQVSQITTLLGMPRPALLDASKNASRYFNRHFTRESQWWELRHRSPLPGASEPFPSSLNDLLRQPPAAKPRSDAHSDSDSDLLVDLLTRLLTVDPANRITAAQALSHPFLRPSGVEGATPPLLDPINLPAPSRSRGQSLSSDQFQSLAQDPDPLLTPEEMALGLPLDSVDWPRSPQSLNRMLGLDSSRESPLELSLPGRSPSEGSSERSLGQTRSSPSGGFAVPSCERSGEPPTDLSFCSSTSSPDKTGSSRLRDPSGQRSREGSADPSIVSSPYFHSTSSNAIGSSSSATKSSDPCTSVCPTSPHHPCVPIGAQPLTNTPNPSRLIGPPIPALPLAPTSPSSPSVPVGPTSPPEPILEKLDLSDHPPRTVADRRSFMRPYASLPHQVFGKIMNDMMHSTDYSGKLDAQPDQDQSRVSTSLLSRGSAAAPIGSQRSGNVDPKEYMSLMTPKAPVLTVNDQPRLTVRKKAVEIDLPADFTEYLSGRNIGAGADCANANLRVGLQKVRRTDSHDSTASFGLVYPHHDTAELEAAAPPMLLRSDALQRRSGRTPPRR